jgi:hypothetical protein
MIVPFMQALPRLLSSVTLDDNSVGLIACIIGAVGGFYITNYREKLKAQKAKIERKNDLPPRE